MSFQLTKILVATDFSACARQALALALSLAKRHGSKLLLVHVVSAAAFVDPTGGDLRASLQRSWREVDAQVRSQGLTAESMTVDGGAPATELTRLAREGLFSLIVIGTHGRTGLEQLLLGSVAEAVVRQSEVPVLTARLRPSLPA